MPLARFAFSLGAAALIVGCGGYQPPVAGPPAGASALAQRWPRVRGEVQYFSNVYGGGLLEYNYPKSESPIGSISYAGGGLCTKGARTFWASASGGLAEFKVGGKAPIKVLKTSAYTSGCAIDPATGDLAALNFFGGVTIYHKARGKGKVISGSGEEYFDGYDNQSNLFVDGFNSSHGVALVELKKGTSTFETITTSNTIEFPGSVQWDGTYLTVLDQVANAIYQYTIDGTNATLKGTVVLSGSSDCAASWIATPYVYCADAGDGDGEVFKYPAGGPLVATLSGMDFPLGVVALSVR